MTKKRISDARLKLLNDISDLDGDLDKLEEKRASISEKICVIEKKMRGLNELLRRSDLVDNYGTLVICNKIDECVSSYCCPHGRVRTCDGTCTRYCSEAEEQGLDGDTCIPVTKPKKVKHGRV